MFSTTDTIVAIATPPGRGGIGVVRLSGPGARAVAQSLVTHRDPLQPRYATFTRLRSHVDTASFGAAGPIGQPAISIDHAIVTFFPAPHSYTGEDVVELSAHGSPVVLRAIVTAAIARGARLAEPGEFTLRAFLHGRIDLMQAEAVNDLIDAATPLQARAAFDQLDGTLTRAIAAIDATLFDLIARLEASVDFPEEGYHFVEPGALAEAIDELIARSSALLGDARRGRLIREGLRIAIVGEPNVGKSSLFNALAGASRAIVTDTPGTTRDLVTEVVDIEGLRVTLVDTAGLRDTDDPVEVEGVARARQALAAADLVLRVEDRSRPRIGKDSLQCKVIYVANKSDLTAAWSDDDAVPVSATTGAGLDELRQCILAALDVEPRRDRPAMTNVRHITLVDRAQQALARARAAACADGGSLSEEFVLADLTDARAAFEEISGRRAPEELLEHIFSKFCIGK
ncbi:MAG TPA: tRNA uridine-5-carboxymethylaminomethyl(34) synthesis GTPase MnmE [Vicinamibacterales bacterium]|nr:tRNA uridine-5-carboxymethylaminomethyl(34) synthesis GTPase MnmE [Vicinamibacterales bacterium]